VAFKSSGPSTPPPESPEELYRDLRRRPGAAANLWVHQGDLLRTYVDEHTTTPDLAIEGPTGTGKTLPGLVIADWLRRTGGRVAYACPTRQLARQVSVMASREGVPAVVLVGPAASWSVADQTRYESAESLALVTYSTLFNSNPKLAQPEVLLFDDAHAGEQYVAGQYAVEVRRWEHPGAYDALLAVLSPALDGMLLQRLRDDSPDPGVHHQVRMVIPLRQPGMVGALDQELAALTGDTAFRFSMIRGSLSACSVYLTYSRILIRPLIPPTADNALFSGARQRLYLSATLGVGGELERSFGRASISRLALPAAAPTPRSGRRFFVFPELVEGTNPREIAQEAVALAGKALVLAPDTDTAVQTAEELAQPGWPVLRAADVADGMGPFADLYEGTCGLASRYDGLDLPGDACRAVVMEGTPDQDSLQEKFLSERVRAGAALAERVRTRVVQGAGRCTRGPDDWALVLVLGADLTKYLLRRETLAALEPELQAEIRFGVQNTQDTTSDDVMDNVETFLAQGDVWRDEAEPEIAELRRTARRVLPAGTNVFAAAVALEIEACELAAAARWAEAAAIAQDVAQVLGTGGEATRGYRAVWLYLAGTWADEAAAVSGDARGRRLARALIAQAEKAAKPGTWTRDLAPLPDTEPEALGTADITAVAAVATKLGGGVLKGRHDTRVAGMLEGLTAREPGKYEPALTVLGQLLGADAGKPSGRGRCDSAWCWDEALWLAVEAKSNHEPTGVVPHKDIRQANDQLRFLCHDRSRDSPPTDSATVVVSPKPAVDPDGVIAAEAHVYLTHPDTVLTLAHDADAAWKDILAGRAGQAGDDLRALVAAAFTTRGVLPTQVLDRLTDHPIQQQ